MQQLRELSASAEVKNSDQQGLIRELRQRNEKLALQLSSSEKEINRLTEERSAGDKRIAELEVTCQRSEATFTKTSTDLQDEVSHLKAIYEDVVKQLAMVEKDLAKLAKEKVRYCHQFDQITLTDNRLQWTCNWQIHCLSLQRRRQH